MKLRIKGSTLRLRLTQGEIQALAAGAAVEETVPFAAGSALVYRLRREGTISVITASYSGNLIEVRVPDEQALRWCGTELVGLEQVQAVPEGSLRITLEKDYACLAPREGEDESDNFPHPQTGKVRC